MNHTEVLRLLKSEQANLEKQHKVEIMFSYKPGCGRKPYINMYVQKQYNVSAHIELVAARGYDPEEGRAIFDPDSVKAAIKRLSSSDLWQDIENQFLARIKEQEDEAIRLAALALQSIDVRKDVGQSLTTVPASLQLYIDQAKLADYQTLPVEALNAAVSKLVDELLPFWIEQRSALLETGDDGQKIGLFLMRKLIDKFQSQGYNLALKDHNIQ